MKYLIEHGKDGARQLSLSWAQDFGHACLEVREILGHANYDAIPPIRRGNKRYGTFIWNFTRNGESEYLKAFPVLPIDCRDRFDPFSIGIHKDYSIFA